MKHIIVTTDFSASSRNALAYACSLAIKGDYTILLMHIYTMPVNYTGDGIALASVSHAISHVEDSLTDEMEWVKESYPAINISYKAETGTLIECLEEEISAAVPELIVMGAASDYGDLWMWDSQLLEALTSMPVPVLIVPKHVVYGSLKQIAFACDYRNLCIPRQVQFIKWLTVYTGAQLHIVHITRDKPVNEEVKMKNELLLQEVLYDAAPKYYAIEDPHVIDAIAGFVKEHNIDMLIVVPHKHGVWHSIFSQSHTKQLAKLNHIPVLAIPEP